MTTPVLDPLVQEAYEKLQEIQQKVDEFFDKVNSVLSWVPFFLQHLIEPIRAAIEALNAKLREFWDRANQLMEQPGSPSRLDEVAEQWTNEVATAVGEVAGTVSPDQLRTNIEWVGRAAEAYRATVPAQVDGLNGVKGLAEQMRTSLNLLANSVENFWLAIGIAFTTFIVGAVGAIIAAATVVGIPAAVAALATAVGVSIGLITAAIMALKSHLNTIETQQNAIATRVTNLGTTWAASDVGTMADASVTDGDASDWRVNR